MNAYVHYELTRRWALEEGFSEKDAETIASADVGVDRDLPGRRWRYKQFHFRWLGARRHARRFLARAVEDRDPAWLGRALHCEQDAWSHGHLGHVAHYPGIDSWEKRSPRVRRRIERVSREMLRHYLERSSRGLPRPKV